MEKINPNFLSELFKKIFLSKDLLTVCCNCLDYSLIPKEEVGFKFILKEIKTGIETGGPIPSIGMIAQKYSVNESVQLTIGEIQSALVVEDELLLNQLESYIKDSRFVLMNKRVVDLYNEGKKEEAIAVSKEESEAIHNFSLRSQGGQFLRVFGDYELALERIMSPQVLAQRVPFGIDYLDDKYGGMDPGDTALWIARSGVGKSTLLRWTAMSAALNGFDVLHIICEESKEKIHTKYTTMWTGKTISELRNFGFSDKELDQIQKTITDIQNFSQDIYLYSFKKFGDASVVEVRNLIYDYFKSMGRFPRVVVIDSFNLLKTGYNSKVDLDPKPKYKFQECAKRLKNIAEETECVIVSATQTGDVPFEVWNDEEKVIDRSYVEGDRTVVQPFSWCFSVNQTLEEVKMNTARIYKDKVRDYENDDPVFRIATNYRLGKFYDRKETLNRFKGEKVVMAAKSNHKRVRKTGNDTKAMKI